LAGGCFKSLVHGKSINDFDLWPASENDRTQLIEALLTQGCTLIRHGEFNSLLHSQDLHTLIEVTIKCPNSIYECVANFDISLSCIAAEYFNEKIVNVYIHKEISACLKAREVRTVKRLDSMLYRLGTLKRLERYANEFEFEVSLQSVTQIWQLYAGCTEEKKAKMLNAVGMSQNDVPEYAAVLKEFIEGCPQSKCRPFSIDELEVIKKNFSSIQPVIMEKAPIALYLIGLPGSGKTSIVEEILGMYDLSSISSFVNLDMDYIRLFHSEFCKHLKGYSIENDNCRRKIFKELITWFNNGSNSELVLYKGENSLVESCVLKQRRNFILPVHTIASIEFIQFVSRRYGYEPILVDVKVSYEVALRRVESRARATGRYTSQSYLNEAQEDYKILLPNAINTITQMGGRFVSIDNTKDGYGGLALV